MLGALTENRPHTATKNHHVRVTEISLPIPFINISTIVKDRFSEFDFDTGEDGEHFTAMLNHETFPIEDFKYSREGNSKCGKYDPQLELLCSLHILDFLG